MSTNTALTPAATAASSRSGSRFTTSIFANWTFSHAAQRSAARERAASETSTARTDAARFAMSAVASPYEQPSSRTASVGRSCERASRRNDSVSPQSNTARRLPRPRSSSAFLRGTATLMPLLRPKRGSTMRSSSSSSALMTFDRPTLREPPRMWTRASCCGATAYGGHSGKIRRGYWSSDGSKYVSAPSSAWLETMPRL